MTIYYATSAGAGTKSGADWANAWSKTELYSWISSTATAGDVAYIMQGTYSGNGISTSKAGSSSNPIKLIGVKTGTTAEPPTVSDYAYSTDRPVLEASSFYSFTITGGYWWYLNLKFQLGTGNVSLSGCFMNNCYINTGSTSKDALRFHGILLNTYVLAPNSNATKAGIYAQICYRCMSEAGDGNAFNVYTYGVKTIMQSIAKDSAIGLNNTGNDTYPAMLLDNTIYNCTTGISYSSNDYSPTVILNNSISDCTDGCLADQSGTINYGRLFDHNNWYNNTHDMSFDNGSSEDNSYKGSNDIDEDPDFIDASNDDFSISASSGNFNAGIEVIE